MQKGRLGACMDQSWWGHSCMHQLSPLHALSDGHMMKISKSLSLRATELDQLCLQ